MAVQDINEMRLVTGDYRIDFFDRYGGRLKGEETGRTCLYQCIDYGNQRIMELEEAHSFLVVRSIYNSLDDGHI